MLDQSKIECAMFLAKGTFETARDLGILLSNVNPEMADEFKHLALNLQRIIELIQESGFSEFDSFGKGV